MWFLIALTAYFLFALASLIDKVLLKPAHLDSPIVYGFWVGSLSLVVLVAVPFVGLRFLPVSQLLLAVVGGGVFLFGLLTYYFLVKKYEVSKVVPALAAFVPIFTLLWSFLFLGERLSSRHFTAVAVLIVGGVLATYESSERFFTGAKHFVLLFGSALFFSAGAVISKYLYDAQGFWDGFIWLRLGEAAIALLFLAVPLARQAIGASVKQTHAPTSGLFVVNQVLGGSAFVLQNYAIALASVTLVQALEATKYVLLLVMTFLISLFWPRIVKESFNRGALVQKISAIIVVGFGLWLLT